MVLKTPPITLIACFPESSYIRPLYVPNVENTTKNHTTMSLGRHWLNMDPFGITFGTLGLHLDPIWGVLGAVLVSLGSIFGCLGHLHATQSCPECRLDSQSRFSERFFTKLYGILLQLHVLEGSSKVVFLDYATVVRF